MLPPFPGQPRVVQLKPLVTSEIIDVGEYSYYDDPNAFEARDVLCHYGPEPLVIGKLCALGTGVRFIMNGANHRMDGPSTFPFPMLGGSWTEHFDLLTGLPGRGDTVVCCRPRRNRHRRACCRCRCRPADFRRPPLRVPMCRACAPP